MKKWICCACFMLLFCLTCCSASPSESETEIETIETEVKKVESDADYFVSYHERKGIHFYDIRRRNMGEKQPVLFFIHGLTNCKEGMVDYAKSLADEGYFVIVPDLPGHGESVTSTPMNTYDIIHQAAIDCGEMLTFYNKSRYADTSRFGIAGFSMGGMTALYYGAYSDNRPQCVISICGTPEWDSLLDKGVYDICQNGKFTPIDDEEKKKEVITVMVQNSPDNNLEYLLQIPILLINGEDDEMISISEIRNFVLKSKLFPNKLENITIEGRGHDIMLDDMQDVKEFLQKYIPRQVE